MRNDLTFITNEEGNNLKNRLAILIRDTRFFDASVEYFYSSGFHAIYPSLENTEKIRILIGISTNQETYDLLRRIQSHKEVCDQFGQAVKEELETSDTNLTIETSVDKFLEWLKSGKLEIRAFPHNRLHAKLYIMTFTEDDRDVGRVVTGSSNFTESGLVDDLELTVELKSPTDYEFARAKFEELWAQGVDVSDKYVETIRKDTWLRQDITPYELYLKFLYEYFRDEINEDAALEHYFRPENFKQLKYQDDAVVNARKIVDEYGGVFLADVVGLGKTYMGTMLCQELNLKTLVLAPPRLIDENNNGSWPNAFRDFGFRSREYCCRSIGSLDKVIAKNEHRDCKVVLIDEAHRFRNEVTESYANWPRSAGGKRSSSSPRRPTTTPPKTCSRRSSFSKKADAARFETCPT